MGSKKSMRNMMNENPDRCCKCQKKATKYLCRGGGGKPFCDRHYKAAKKTIESRPAKRK